MLQEPFQQRCHFPDSVIVAMAAYPITVSMSTALVNVTFLNHTHNHTLCADCKTKISTNLNLSGHIANTMNTHIKTKFLALI